jgi:hypothetical protein
MPIMVTGGAIASPWRSASGGGSGWAEHAAAPRSASGTAGRATGVMDRGQRSAVAYDDRGNAIWTARQMAVMPFGAMYFDGDMSGDYPVLTEGSGPSELHVLYDAEPGHTYIRTSEYDHAGRGRRLTLPLDPDFDGPSLGGGPVVSGELELDPRGRYLHSRHSRGVMDEIVERLVRDTVGECRFVEVGTGSGLTIGWVRPLESVEGRGGPVLAIFGQDSQIVVHAPATLFESVLRRRGELFLAVVGIRTTVPDDAVPLFLGGSVSDGRAEPFGGSKIGGYAVQCVHGGEEVRRIESSGGVLLLQLETPGASEPWPDDVAWPFPDSVTQLFVVRGEVSIVFQR